MSKSQNLLTFLHKLFSDNKNETKIDVKDLTTEGANYSSKIYNISVTKKDGEHLQLFAKVASISEEMRKKVNLDNAFNIERYFYSVIKPLYEQLQNKYISDPEEWFKIPKFYGCNSDLLDETIVLEDLAVQGYTLFDRFKPLSLEYATKAVQEIAKFHALNFAFKLEYPDLYAEQKNKFNWINTFYKNLREPFLKNANSIYKIVPENMKQRLMNFVEHSLSDEGIEKYTSLGKWGILIHGDYRASNIMHKSLENGVVSSLIPVDYQTLSLGSPILDIIYLLYLGTDEEFRRRHLKDILEIYYEKLSSLLKQLNLNPNEVFSKDDFYQDYKHFLSYGLFIATFLLPIVLVDLKDAPEFGNTDSDVDDFSVNLSDRFKERYVPILNEFANIGII